MTGLNYVTFYSLKIALLWRVIAFASSAFAQDSYEIQVYGSALVPRKATMVELHSNFTLQGSKQTTDGVLPTEHALHETLEVTHGFTPWFETGFYIFSSARSGDGWQWVGTHVRPRVTVPESWHWPVGASLSSEFGYVRRSFSLNTWTWEIRPILDKQIGRWYFAVNPAFELPLYGAESSQGFQFAPSYKLSYNLSKKISAGVEYYSSLGPVTRLSPWPEQQHQIFPVIDLNLGPKWEFNFGVGVGLTRSTDHLLIKMIVGREF